MLTILLTVVLAQAQAPAPAAAPAAAPTAAPAAGAQPQTQAPAAESTGGPGGYSYNPEGRRDPFVSLVGRGNDPKQQGSRVAGVPGLLVNEVTVKGIIRGRSGYLAMIQAADNKTYIVRSGDRLADGAVKTITQDGVVFSQDVHDPLSLVKQREIPKRVRATEGRG
jgi:type IV pilus assembly protein PilP